MIRLGHSFLSIKMKKLWGKSLISSKCKRNWIGPILELENNNKSNYNYTWFRYFYSCLSLSKNFVESLWICYIIHVVEMGAFQWSHCCQSDKYTLKEIVFYHVGWWRFILNEWWKTRNWFLKKYDQYQNNY